VALAPRLVPASGDADVFELWDVGEKRVPNHRAGVRVVVAVQHQHRRLDGVERLRFEARRLTAKLGRAKAPDWVES
jgi:hypothetical protein